MDGFDPFTGTDVLLRAFEPGDAQAVHEYLNDPALRGRRYAPDRFPGDTPLTAAQAEKIVEAWQGTEHGFALAVVLRQTGAVIGHASADWGWEVLAPWADVVIAPHCQRMGYGTQAARLVLAYLFEQTPAHIVIGGWASWNDPAAAFAQSFGFETHGAMRRAGLRDGAPYDFVTAALRRLDWAASHAGSEGGNGDAD